MEIIKNLVNLFKIGITVPIGMWIPREYLTLYIICALGFGISHLVFLYVMRNNPTELSEDFIDENGNHKKTHKKFR